jgi:Zn-dependent peptidase ImmA (M78 family)/transcriptional regulator with XRE-family HTH domain
MARVAVSADVLRWARERSGVSIAQLATKLPRVAEWESGEVQPTLRQLETFASATLTPLGQLFLLEPPEDRLPIPSYRTLGDRGVVRPSPNLLDTVYIMLRRQDWMREYLTDLGLPSLPFVGRGITMSSPVDVAGDMRKVLGLGRAWAADYPTWTAALRGLMDRAEEAGILVMTNGVVGNNTHRKLDPEEFRGFVLTDRQAPLVFLNGVDFKAAQMFTLAHELAHLWYEQSAAFDLRTLQPANVRSEVVCNQVAAEFLLPEEELRSIWATVDRSVRPFSELARRFRVSEIVAARRALDLGLIDDGRFYGFYRAYVEDARRRAAEAKDKDTGGGDFYNTQGRRIGFRFGDAVVRAAREGRLLYSTAYELTGLRGVTFDRYAKKLDDRRRA